MSQTYYAILTAVGEAKLANAAALNTTLKISKMAVGDGGGNVPTPNRSQTKLVNEWYRAGLNSLTVDPANTSQIIAELVIPEESGGSWIREMGLLDADGNLIAVANTPPSYKPQLAEGSGRTQVLRMVLIVSSTSNVELKIDPSVVLSTRKYVDDSILAVLPKREVAGSYTKVTVNERGVVTDGENPTTLEGYGITDALFIGTAPSNNLDLCVLPGMYRISSGTLGLPASGAPSGSMCLHLGWSSDNWQQQIFSRSSDLIQWRRCDGGVISEWRNSGSGDPGDISYTAASTPGTGKLKANGAAVSRTAYARLFERIGTTFGAGNGSTTFNLPDLRGESIRGWDDGRGIDSGRTLGSWQDGQNEAHTHSATIASAGAHTHSASTSSAGSHKHAQTGLALDTSRYDTTGGPNPYTADSVFSDTQTSVSMDAAGDHTHSVTVASNGAHTHTATISSSGGSEVRVRNVALLACIQY